MAAIEHKLVTLEQAKASNDGFGSIEGYASTFHHTDSYGDTVVPGAYAEYLPEFKSKGFIAADHFWGFAQHVATPSVVREDKVGLFLKADYHSTQHAQEVRTVAQERLDRRLSVGMSIGYQPVQWSFKEDPDSGRQIRQLEVIKLFEVSIVAVPADDYARAIAAKDARWAYLRGQIAKSLGVSAAVLDALVLEESDDDLAKEQFDALSPEDQLGIYYECLAAGDETSSKAVWSTALVNSFPDSSFAVIEPGGTKDSEGKTTPRSLRHLPHHDGSGKLDAPHVRNGLARVSQLKLSDELKSRGERHLRSHADDMGIGKANTNDHPHVSGLTFADRIERAIDAVQEVRDDTEDIAALRAKAGRALSEARRRRLAQLRDELTALLDETEPARSADDEEDDDDDKGQQPPETPDATTEAEQIWRRFTTLDSMYRAVERTHAGRE